MNQVEILRHVADNLEAGRDAGHGLVLWNQPCLAKSAGEIFFSQHHEYSLAPRTRIINGVEVPAPMDNEPAAGSVYWCEAPANSNCSFYAVWSDHHIDKMRFERGQCYSTQEAAAANCRAHYGLG